MKTARAAFKVRKKHWGNKAYLRRGGEQAL
jgi:hypothetical protein